MPTIKSLALGAMTCTSRLSSIVEAILAGLRCRLLRNGQSEQSVLVVRKGLEVARIE
jgi:hypothetical protein